MNYEKSIENILNILRNAKFVVLATSNKNGIVSACQMCIVNDGLKVYFQTDSSFEKIQNIKENSNVAINIGKYYFKGIAKIVGHPSNNINFINKIKEKHPETYSRYTNLLSEVLIEVELTECKIWCIDNTQNIHNEDIIQVIDFNKRSIRKIICNKL